MFPQVTSHQKKQTKLGIFVKVKEEKKDMNGRTLTATFTFSPSDIFLLIPFKLEHRKDEKLKKKAIMQCMIKYYEVSKLIYPYIKQPRAKSSNT